MLCTGFSDPYAYVWIEPIGRKTQCKTKTMFKTLNPVWNHTFELYVHGVPVGATREQQCKNKKRK